MYKKGLPSLLNCLLILGRYPVPGRTKTRLIPYLGPAGAAHLQKELTEAIIRKARSVAGIADIIFFYEGGSKRAMSRWLGRDLIYHPQYKGDIGERMRHAILMAKELSYEKIVLVGTDIPGIEPEDIKKAFDRLSEYDVVIGPSDDGGYWLIGMNSYHDIFQGISWGTDQVLSHSLELIKRKGLKVSMLRELTDVDTKEDIKKTGLKINLPYVSVVIPTLNEEKNIERAIKSAVARDSEVIIVDGGSRDRTKQIAINLGVRVIESRRGRAYQQNRGAEVARGEVLLFLHADTILPDKYVEYIFQTLMDPEVLLGAFGFRTDMRHPFMMLIELVANIRARYLGLPYGDQAIFMRKRAFESLGKFPEIPAIEDLYFMDRISKLGKIKICPEYAITSARKWRKYGLLKVTCLHWEILLRFWYQKIKKGGWV